MKKMGLILLLSVFAFAGNAQAQDNWGYVAVDYGVSVHYTEVDEWNRYYEDNTALTSYDVDNTDGSGAATRFAVGFHPTKNVQHTIEIGRVDLGEHVLAGNTDGNSFTDTYSVKSQDTSYITRFKQMTFRIGTSSVTIEENGSNIASNALYKTNDGNLWGVGFEINNLRFEYASYGFSYDVTRAGETYGVYSGAALLSVGYKFNF